MRLFDSVAGERRLCALYSVAAVDGFGEFGRAELAAAGAIVEYVSLTQKGKLPRLAALSGVSEDASMAIDAATRRNLELTHALAGGRKGSLLSVIDRTVSGLGARLLHARLAAPLTDPDAIARRFDQVEFFVTGAAAREAMRTALRAFPDIERTLSRLTVGRGGPRDLAAVRDGLALAPRLRAILDKPGELAVSGETTAALADGLGQHDILAACLAKALVPTPPLFIRDGGFIATGYNAPFDEFVTLRDESRRLIANLEACYRAETDVQSLKIKHNNVLGYFVDVSERNVAKLGVRFIHRQTLASAVRFTTVELGELENKINNAAQKALDLEAQLFDQLLGEVTAQAEDIARLAPGLVLRCIGMGEVCQAWGGLLSGMPLHPEPPRWTWSGANQGSMVITFRIELFCPPEAFKREMDEYVRAVRQLQPLKGFEEAHMPGGIEAQREARYRREGVPVSADHRQRLDDLASELGIAPL